jgi:hypothetical protein
VARAVAMAGTLLVLLHATPTAEGQTLDGLSEDTLTAANEASVNVVDLLGAMASTGLSAREYLHMTGELHPSHSPQAPPSVSSGSAALAARVACIESKESGGANTWNRQGSGAGGVLQYQSGTFAAHAAEMGHPEWSRWNPAQARAVAAHDLALGRRAQWTVSGC